MPFRSVEEACLVRCLGVVSPWKQRIIEADPAEDQVRLEWKRGCLGFVDRLAAGEFEAALSVNRSRGREERHHRGTPRFRSPAE